MRYALITVAAAALFAVGGIAQASPRVTPQLQKSHLQTLSFTGRVESVDYKNGTFLVRHEQNGRLQEKEFKMEPSTRVSIDGQWVAPFQLEQWDHVTVTYVAPR
jgi:hypothetical protein